MYVAEKQVFKDQVVNNYELPSQTRLIDEFNEKFPAISDANYTSVIEFAKNSVHTDWIIDLLKEYVLKNGDQVERYWIYVTAGGIGGGKALEFLYSAKNIEKGKFAIRGIQEGLKLIQSLNKEVNHESI